MNENISILAKFYINPWKNNQFKIDKIFKASFIVYLLIFLTNFILKTLFSESISKTERLLFREDGVILSIKFFGLFLKYPIQWFLMTLVLYVILHLFNKRKEKLFSLYKKIFISFAVICISLSIDILLFVFSIIFQNHFIVKLNILTFSIGDYFIGDTICAYCFSSILYRINILLLLSTINTYFILTDYEKDVSIVLRLVIIITSLTITFLLLTSLPKLILLLN